MTRREYLEEIEEDIREYIDENADYIRDEIGAVADRTDWEEHLTDALWAVDAVTGNASGSYYCNAACAVQAVSDALDVLCDALDDWGADVGEYRRCLLDPERADVTIRCYLLGAATAQVLDDMEEDGFFDYAEEE